VIDHRPVIGRSWDVEQLLTPHAQRDALLHLVGVGGLAEVDHRVSIGFSL
jgi:hypothetical protein